MATTGQIEKNKEAPQWEPMPSQLTTEELELYRKMADYEKEEIGTWLRDTLRGAAKSMLEPEFFGDLMARELKTQLARIVDNKRKAAPSPDTVLLTVKVTRTKWDRFMKLPEPVRKAYLNRIVDDCVEGLFDDPKMLGYYMSKYAKQ